VKERNIILAIFTIGFMLLAGCDVSIRNEVIRGTGERVSQSFPFDNFTGVELSGSGVVNFHHSETNSITVTMYENLFDYLEMNVRSGTLDIGFRRGVGIELGEYGKQIDIYAPMLERLDVSGSFTTGYWDTIYASSFSVDISGFGSFSFNMQVDTLEIDASGAATFELSGVADDVNIVSSGFGNINAAYLQAQDARIDISGSSTVEIAVSDNLDVTLSGFGGVRYIGTPTVTQSISGFGTVEQR